jgi:hypothetical protein
MLFFAVQSDAHGPEAELTRDPRFGRDRVKSGHNSDIAEVKRLPHSLAWDRITPSMRYMLSIGHEPIVRREGDGRRADAKR